jgi:hypothetical protein
MDGVTGRTLQPDRAADPVQALGPTAAEPALESPKRRLSAAVAHRVRNRPPTEPAQVADEGVVFPLGDRLAAEQTGGRQEPALHPAEYLSEASH